MNQTVESPWGLIVKTSLVALALAIGVLTAGCLTIGVVNEALGNFPHEAKIKSIRGALTQGDDLIVHVDVKTRGRNGAQDVLLRVPISKIGSYQFVPRSAPFEEGNLKLTPRATGCFETAKSLPVDSKRLPIEKVTVRHQGELDGLVSLLPVGVHVLAVTFESKPSEREPRFVEAESAELPKNASMALAVRNVDGHSQSEIIWGFEKQPSMQGAWLLLIPLTVVGDVVTLPLQIVAAFIGGC